MLKYIILTSGRSGSNFLTNQLNKHPRVFNYGEVLGAWTLPYKLMSKFRFFGMSWSRYVEFFYESKSLFAIGQLFAFYLRIKRSNAPAVKSRKSIEAIGIKELGMCFHDRNLMDFCRNHPDIKVINLYRTNALRRLLSVKTLDNTGVVANNGSSDIYPPRYQVIHIDLKTFEKDIARIEEVAQMQADIVAGLDENQVYNICYEDLFASAENKAAYSKGVFDFLGVEALPIQGGHRRLSLERLQDMIENYDELYGFCKGTRYEVYFDELLGDEAIGA